MSVFGRITNKSSISIQNLCSILENELGMNQVDSMDWLNFRLLGASVRFVERLNPSPELTATRFQVVRV